MNQSQKLKGQNLLLPVEVKGVVRVEFHERLPGCKGDAEQLLEQFKVLIQEQYNGLN